MIRQQGTNGGFEGEKDCNRILCVGDKLKG
jgi:hypothetical protein